MNIRFLLAYSLLLAAAQVGAQKYSNDFLNIGVGARAHGMAGAQAAFVNDITAIYWNPAGLAGIQAPAQAAAMHAEWFAGIGKYDYIGFGKSLNKERQAYLAFSVIRLGIDQIPNTLSLYNADGTPNYDNITEFSAADYAIMAGYGRQLRNKAFSVGGTFKIIRRVIGTFGNAWGFGADLGMQYRKGRLALGVTARDLTTTFNAWSFSLSERDKQTFLATGNELPQSGSEITKPTFILGGAYRLKIGAKTNLLPAVDLVLSTDGQRNVLVSAAAFNLDPRVGIELDYNNFLQIRAGAGNFQRVIDDFNASEKKLTVQPNFGIGMKLNRVQLDYALTDIGNLSIVQYSHIFSLKFNFREPRTKAGS